LPKNIANIQEVRSRNARVIAIATEGSELTEKFVDDLILIPDVHPAVQPIVATIPVQLFAYHVAKLRGCDIDKPRNLAKSVTVE
jgi:glucosamine--fructose-6-phosphate aminotransferase (isomerizing)